MLPERLLDSIILSLFLLPFAVDAAEIQVQVVRQGDSYEVQASARIDAELSHAWKILTAYDRLAEFIPGMKESRVVSREGSKVVVEQRGEATMLFLTYPMEVRLEIEEQPFERIVSNAVGGNFKDLHGEYLLEPRDGGLLLRYRGRFTPDFGFVPLLGTLIVRNNLERRFGAMVREIEKDPGGAFAPAGKQQ